ncbi:hypothetical protein F4802DRAFT_560775 [Xylaria palmicola]|nr:hypothetical protein F4802DRAFT_560775 [Xylaria palmicola]
MASSSSTLAASTLARPRVLVVLVSTVAAVSLGYYYYRRHRSTEQPDLDASGPSPRPGPGARLHRRNAQRRPRRPDQGNDDSSGSESHGDDNVDPAAFASLNETTPDLGDVAVPLSGPVPQHDENAGDWFNDHQNNDRLRTGENIVGLLFRVSEDNARRNAYVHRGCLCNGCGMLPIRGIRYRCANCPDFDLCEMCESQGTHNKAHVFYKVKVPVPPSAARHVQAPWYPGDPSNVAQSVPRHLLAKWSHETGFERVELDALWEQWTFMANTEWREDPNGLFLAMDRKTFERCLVPTAGYRHPAPNLIHDRMFAFYDTNHDGLIGFEEYLHGVSYKRRKDKLRRTFDGYDVDGDGYVNRRDFLRMFRAYYVSYKQMHRDTVEGLDDYMATNVEVQQLVNSRQPISSLFGRDQRIPDTEGSRHMEGKVFRSGGFEAHVSDGKGVVTEDKPDASSREDILQELFIGNSNQSLFTESFGSSSRRPQSPARDTPYWSGLLNPPRSTVDLAALLAGDHAQLDDIIESIRHQGQFIADDDESGTSDDSQSTPDLQMGHGLDMNHHSIDGNDHPTVYPGSPSLTEELDTLPPDAREFINTLPVRVESSRREPIVSHQQLNFDKRKRVIARKQLYERWKRRQFYLDEEEGGMPPQGWREEQDILVNVNDVVEPSKTAPPLLSPRSRSSSKVRFAEDTDDFETRSNPSTSSRSVPERWGGMEIPDAERDVGKEILYQVTQQAFNELLDVLFKKKEDLAVLVAETKEQREKHRQLLDNFELQDEDEPLEPPGLGQPRRTRPIQQQSLQELLSTSGYAVASPGIGEDGRSVEVPTRQSHNIERDLRNDQANCIAPATGPSPDNPTLAASEYRDPTMPQFMPNSVPLQAQGLSMEVFGEGPGEIEISITSTSRASISDQEAPPGSEPRIARPDTPSHIPRSTLARWKALEQAEHEARERGGWGRLSYAEFEEIYREHEFMDGSKNRLAYLGSWIDFCIPS